MLDLHCHILPAIDDGPSDVSDSVDMARQAEADGITAICATPHIRHDHDVRIRELPRRLADLRASIDDAGCRTRILPGGEVAETALSGLSDDDLAAVTVGGGGRWILLEPAPGPLSSTIESAVKHLGERGFRALVAHPERHLAPELVERLLRLVDLGDLVQATAASVTDPSARDGMLALAESGVIHVLGSDAHSARAGRPVTLAASLSALAAVDRLANHREWIAETAPAAIVAGLDLTPPF